MRFSGSVWWAQKELNLRPLACEASALAAEPCAHLIKLFLVGVSILSDLSNISRNLSLPKIDIDLTAKSVK